MIPLRDIGRQYAAMREEIDEAVARVLRSGHFILGQEVECLEEELAKRVGVTHCITCASGTDALHLSLAAIGIKAGDAVFVPDFTFFATAEAVAMCGAVPIFVDVDEQTFCISPSALAERIDDIREQGELRPAAVMAVDLFGRMADYDALHKICQREGLLLVEDAAQSFGAHDGAGRNSCAAADVAATSFFPSKPLGCFGDGGAVFTNDGQWADIARSLRVHGKGTDKYDNIRVGMNSRLDAIQAAILRVKLRHLDNELATVRLVASRYNEALAPHYHTPVEPQDWRNVWAQYTIVPRHEQRADTMARLDACGIAHAIYYPRTMREQPAFRTLLQHQRVNTTAERLSTSVLSIPMGPYIAADEVERVIAALNADR